jgi:chloramphenicol 3-O phosphotransferase
VSTRVIILDGVGSVGKSSTAKPLQTITTEPFLLVQKDTFSDMLPETMIGHPDGVIFETVHDDGKPSVIIRTGPVTPPPPGVATVATIAPYDFVR